MRGGAVPGAAGPCFPALSSSSSGKNSETWGRGLSVFFFVQQSDYVENHVMRPRYCKAPFYVAFVFMDPPEREAGGMYSVSGQYRTPRRYQVEVARQRD